MLVWFLTYHFPFFCHLEVRRKFHSNKLITKIDVAIASYFSLSQQQQLSPTWSIHIWKCHPILFYHLKKLLYQLYHIILQYTQHLIFYFPIQYIKIIYLHNKIYFSLLLKKKYKYIYIYIYFFSFLSLSFFSSSFSTIHHHPKPRPMDSSLIQNNILISQYP